VGRIFAEQMQKPVELSVWVQGRCGLSWDGLCQAYKNVDTMHVKGTEEEICC